MSEDLGRIPGHDDRVKPVTGKRYPLLMARRTSTTGQGRPAQRSSGRSPGGRTRAAAPVESVPAPADGAATEPAKRTTSRKNAAAQTKKRQMSENHRAALQAGREETRIVRAYLDALEQHRPRRGPRKDPEKLRQRLAAVKSELAGAQPLERLTLHQEQIDLERELEQSTKRGDLSELEKSFVEVAASYSRRHGLSAQAWLAVGVGKATLKKAGITG